MIHHIQLKDQLLSYLKVSNFIYLYFKYLESQKKTQGGDSKRPYGVGTLICGYDFTGPRLFRTCPSGFYYEYTAQAIGSRCQTANTYLENNLESFQEASESDLIRHAIAAMKKSQDIKLTSKNLDITIVGKDTNLRSITEEELEKYLNTGMILD